MNKRQSSPFKCFFLALVGFAAWSLALEGDRIAGWSVSIGRSAHAGCFWGCKDRLHQCRDGCPLNLPELRTCQDLVEATEPRVRHHIHHHCKGTKTPEQVVDCGWSAMLADNYGQAITGGLLRLCGDSLPTYKNLVYNHPLVRQKIQEHVGYWKAGNPWAVLEAKKDNVVKDVAGIVGGNAGTTTEEARGGPTVATNRTIVANLPDEQCKPIVVSNDYHLPADGSMFDWTPTQAHGDYTFQAFSPPQPATPAMYNPVQGVNIGANEGRLRADLRAGAQRARIDPLLTLCESAKRFAAGDSKLGNVFADLSVTGRQAFARFRTAHPNESSLHLRAECAGVPEAALRSALDRAYRVASVIRIGNSPDRSALGWIAVSGEDDQPYRPVNVPSAEFPQFELAVSLPGRPPVNTRYMIAHRRPPAFPRSLQPLVDGGPGRQVPADLAPALAPDAEVILFIHGMDSRLEEALDLTHALHRLPDGKNWTVIAIDLPTSGYADNIDHTQISPIEATGNPKGPDGLDFDAHGKHVVPVVDFIEDFIVAFVDKLDQTIPVKARLLAFAGGSLGGNISMRLGRRPGAPWIRNVIPWSPAAIWPSFADGANVFNHAALSQPWKWAGGLQAEREETPDKRRVFFYGAFNWAPPTQRPQAEYWYRDGWPCKQSHIIAARLDRQETYNGSFRRWHWRLGLEQLIFSHQLRGSDGKELYLQNTKRMFLSCGYDDTGGGLCQHTRGVAARMINTPGYARFLKTTGHSIDNERPAWMAQQIAEFLAQDRQALIIESPFRPGPGALLRGQGPIIQRQ